MALRLSTTNFSYLAVILRMVSGLIIIGKQRKEDTAAHESCKMLPAIVRLRRHILFLSWFLTLKIQILKKCAFISKFRCYFIFIESCHHSQFSSGHGVALKDNTVRIWRQEAGSTIYISTTSRLLPGRTCPLQLRAQSLLPDSVMVLLQRAAVYSCSEDVHPTSLMNRVSVSALLIYSPILWTLIASPRLASPRRLTSLSACSLLPHDCFRWDSCCSAALGRDLNETKQRKMMTPAPVQLNSRGLVCFDVRSALRSRPRMAFLRGTLNALQLSNTSAEHARV